MRRWATTCMMKTDLGCFTLFFHLSLFLSHALAPYLFYHACNGVRCKWLYFVSCWCCQCRCLFASLFKLVRICVPLNKCHSYMYVTSCRARTGPNFLTPSPQRSCTKIKHHGHICNQIIAHWKPITSNFAAFNDENSEKLDKNVKFIGKNIWNKFNKFEEIYFLRIFAIKFTSKFHYNIDYQSQNHPFSPEICFEFKYLFQIYLLHLRSVET